MPLSVHYPNDGFFYQAQQSTAKLNLADHLPPSKNAGFGMCPDAPWSLPIPREPPSKARTISPPPGLNNDPITLLPSSARGVGENMPGSTPNTHMGPSPVTFPTRLDPGRADEPRFVPLPRSASTSPVSLSDVDSFFGHALAVSSASLLPAKVEIIAEPLVSSAKTAKHFASHPLISSPPPPKQISPSVNVCASDGEFADRVHVTPLVDGVSGCIQAEWHIANFAKKLKAGFGNTLVSPPFDAIGMSNLRLMIFPDSQGILQGLHGKKKQAMFTKLIHKGPLDCGLKLKVSSSEASPRPLNFYLRVGSRTASGPRAGPFVCSLSDGSIPVQGCDEGFGADWLNFVDDRGSMRVSVEFSQE